MSSKSRLEWQHDGRVARIVLAAPKANILDRAMVESLESHLAGLESHRGLCAIVIASDGPHFSFGASVEEHLPGEIAGALSRLGRLLRSVATAPAPTIAAVRGQCLGGGFELVLACDLIVAEEGAKFGAPEIRLGVFPPAASALLPVRIGAAGAGAMVLTGESWSAATAAQHGLVARTAADGTLDASLAAWLEAEFVPRSPSALRHAARVIRRPVLRALTSELPEIDRVYLEELMKGPDAEEGIRAFLEKREPRWTRPSQP